MLDSQKKGLRINAGKINIFYVRLAGIHAWHLQIIDLKALCKFLRVHSFLCKVEHARVVSKVLTREGYMTTCSISEHIWKTGDGRRDTEDI